MGSSSNIRPLITAGSSAAELLETACERGLDTQDAKRISLVRDLAGDIRDQLEGLANSATGESNLDLISETAIRCADLANLAACNLDGLPAKEALRAAAGVHLAAGAVNALRLLAEGETSGQETGSAAMRDVRGAGWRADLTVRQAKEFLASTPAG